MSTKIKIRQVKNRPCLDWLKIDHLHRICFPKDDMPNLYNGWWWAAYHNSEVIGFCGMEQCEKWYNAGYLCRAGVSPKHQGKGLHKRLIQVRINKAKQLGWDWLITDTTNNPASANSLISKGFKIYAPQNPWAYKRSIYWRKRLT